MGIGLSTKRIRAVTAEVRPRRFKRWVRVLGVGALSGALVVAAAAFGVLPHRSDVQLAAADELSAPITVTLTAFDGAEPFDSEEGPGRDTGPSNSIVRQGDPVTYVIDVGVREKAVSDVVVQLPIPRGFELVSAPDYCGEGSSIDETGLHCIVGHLGADRFFTRQVTMTAGSRAEVDGLPATATVSADAGTVRVHSNAVTVRVATTASGCDPRGVPAVNGGTADGDMTTAVSADGRISGLVSSGVPEFATIEGADQCGHVTHRSVRPYEGRFSFLGLLPGNYRVTVDERTLIDVVLQPGAMAAELTF